MSKRFRNQVRDALSAPATPFGHVVDRGWARRRARELLRKMHAALNKAVTAERVE